MKLLLTPNKLSTNILQTSYKLLTNFLQTSYKLLTNFLQTSYKLLSNVLQISYKLLSNVLQTSYKYLHSTSSSTSCQSSSGFEPSTSWSLSSALPTVQPLLALPWNDPYQGTLTKGEGSVRLTSSLRKVVL
jgi:hypothetical protein